MSWDPVWDRIFQSRDWGRYPPEELVRFVAGAFYARKDRPGVRILEVGCGPGSGTSWFVAREGFSFYGIDASPIAVEKSRARFAQEGLQGEFVLGEVSALPWSDEAFDAVLDNACLACNTEAETARIVDEIHRVLKRDGVHFSLTPRAGCWGDETGERLDATTLAQVIAGPFAGLGKTRFATAESLHGLYRKFRDRSLEYVVRSAEQGTREVSHWLFTCRK